MSGATPRMRMFAGPNGSGKSTLKDNISTEGLPPDWLGTYINADHIEKALRECGGRLELSQFRISTTSQELRSFLAKSTLLKNADLIATVEQASVSEDMVALGTTDVNSYHAAVIADFIRRKLLKAGETFSFETVMSGQDKVNLLAQARSMGYRTYLYYVSTEDPDINIDRIAYRVSQGGHPVPDDKVRSRYHRSLDHLLEAIRNTDRAYIFDNTYDELAYVAEVTGGKRLVLKGEEVPAWFNKAILEKTRSA